MHVLIKISVFVKNTNPPIVQISTSLIYNVAATAEKSRKLGIWPAPETENALALELVQHISSPYQVRDPADEPNSPSHCAAFLHGHHHKAKVKFLDHYVNHIGILCQRRFFAETKSK